MKRSCRILGLFLCFFVVLTVEGLAANVTIDVTTAADGYFSVFYEAKSDLKMKVGVTFAGKTEFHTYVPGKQASYAFDKGEGQYTVSLYRNLSGTSYQRVAKKSVAVKLNDAMAPYLASIMEITFAEGDTISQTAAELCKGFGDDGSKMVAIHNYIAKNFSYNDAFAVSVRQGKVKNYTPDTNRSLSEKAGVCYDISAVFAAMCRSQGIPCKMEKGYTANGYHAWNMIRHDGKWVAVDLTEAVVNRNFRAAKISDCIVSVS